MESGPGPPVDNASDLERSHLPTQPEKFHAPAPQLPPLPPFASWPPFLPVPQPPQLPLVSNPPQVPPAEEAVEVIDLTGLSDDDDGDEWEEVRDVIDLTNLPSSDEDEDHRNAAADEELEDVPQNYTILNLPPRQHTLINGTPLPGQTRSARRAARAATRAAARAARAAIRAAAKPPVRVPVRRDTCELCARVVRWGPGCLITKHHLYPQEITKKHPERYTQAEKGSIALLCRPCHDACHRAHSNRALAEFYNAVDLLKADPDIQAHVSSMQRATTPELIARHGDGVNVRRRKERVRASRSEPHRKLFLQQGKTLSRYKLRERALPDPLPPPASPPPPPLGVRRSARLLAKSMGGQPQVPVIVIEDDDEDQEMQDATLHEDPKGTENEEVQDIVSEEALAALEAIGEYIRL